MALLLREALGDSLRRTRVAQSRTLREVSTTARVSLGYLSEVERGRKEASSELLNAICEALDVPLSDVLFEVSESLTSSDRRTLSGSDRSALSGSDRQALSGSDRQALSGSDRSALSGSARGAEAGRRDAATAAAETDAATGTVIDDRGRVVVSTSQARALAAA
ncbi:helix-turn-helix domain-containing protein [Millisia brevis]|uniref:helix-turn-helix domain-containing protein n=1 Tax=Millisia brevis TaxID=264148 RepID=UPI000830B127|nr:helix-turn-helix domain-containing protein [Millisia brevis]